MVTDILAVAFVGTLVVGPLAWRAWQDRAERRALAVRAAVHRALVRAFKGEPAVSIRVVPSTRWREGRVILSTSCHEDWLVAAAWTHVMQGVPTDYALVVERACG